MLINELERGLSWAGPRLLRSPAAAATHFDRCWGCNVALFRVRCGWASPQPRSDLVLRQLAGLQVDAAGFGGAEEIAVGFAGALQDGSMKGNAASAGRRGHRTVEKAAGKDEIHGEFICAFIGNLVIRAQRHVVAEIGREVSTGEENCAGGDGNDGSQARVERAHSRDIEVE